MSYEYLIAARATRSEKEAAKEQGKKKSRCRKKAGIVSQGSKALDCAIKSSNHGEGAAIVEALVDKAQIDKDGVQIVPFRAPEACMY